MKTVIVKSQKLRSFPEGGQWGSSLVKALFIEDLNTNKTRKKGGLGA